MEVGKCYFVESGTSHYYVGRCVEIIGPHTCKLEDCSWIEYTGRLGQFMREGKAEGAAYEYIIERVIHWVSYQEWKHSLFKGDSDQ